MKKLFNNESGSALIGLLTSLFTLTVMCGIYGGLAWTGGSLVASGVKAISSNCGTVYPVEKVLSADWFCAEPTKEAKTEKK